MVLHTLPFSLHFTCFDLTLNYGKFPSFPFPTFFSFFSSFLLCASFGREHNQTTFFFLSLCCCFTCFFITCIFSLASSQTLSRASTFAAPTNHVVHAHLLTRLRAPLMFCVELTHLSYYTALWCSTKLRQLAELLRLSLRETRLSPVHTHTKPGTSLRAS